MRWSIAMTGRDETTMRHTTICELYAVVKNEKENMIKLKKNNIQKSSLYSRRH